MPDPDDWAAWNDLEMTAAVKYLQSERSRFRLPSELRPGSGVLTLWCRSQCDSASGGPRRVRFSTGDIAFRRWFVGAFADVWRLESSATSERDAEVWAIVAGAAVPVWRGAFGRSRCE